MNVEKRYVVRQISSEGRSVVYIHEFRRNEPNSQTAVLQPCVTQKQEVAVHPGKTADCNPQLAGYTNLQPLLLGSAQVVMSNVWGVCQNEIEASVCRGWCHGRKITPFDFETTLLPK